MPPVTDWVNDWDWLDPQWGPNAIDIWNSVRQQCPVATTERYGRAHMPVTMAAVQQVAHDTEHFSSRKVSVAIPDARAGRHRRSRPTRPTITVIGGSCSLPSARSRSPRWRTTCANSVAA